MIFTQLSCVWEIDLSFREKPYKCKGIASHPQSISMWRMGMNSKQGVWGFMDKADDNQQRTNKRLDACDLNGT